MIKRSRVDVKPVYMRIPEAQIRYGVARNTIMKIARVVFVNVQKLDSFIEKQEGEHDRVLED